ncbi:MAG: DUF4385 domain-containing protein [Planctomycetes bacterium]|nr:DUF4385 domain-containing protein [Planctomycetota bacterium]
MARRFAFAKGPAAVLPSRRSSTEWHGRIVSQTRVFAGQVPLLPDAEAKKSSAKIYKMFLAYLKAEDFPGADVARKFLQMGWTRARRYANHKGGRKYDKKTGKQLPRTEDAEKAAAAVVFYERYVTARQHAEYVRQKKLHQERHESQ